MNVAILNVTGYAGVELARLLLRHPGVQVTEVTGRSAVGLRLSEVLPHLGTSDLVIQTEIEGPVDLAFSALPHKAAAESVAELVNAEVKVIDLSADFRLKDVVVYEQWYEVAHPAPHLLAGSVYGLPELYKEEIKKAHLVASPGCYPTSVILALAPVINLITPDIIADAKSGLSGAGRSLSLTTHYSEANENCQAYALKGHRHLPEMIQELTKLRQQKMGPSSPALALTFIPHLVPMTRGILSTCYAHLEKDCSPAEIRRLYQDFYAEAPFVMITDEPPQTKHTWGSNRCLIYPTVDERTGRLIVISCLDNLVKGAAGQAIQSMNLMLGLAEQTGLDSLPIYP